MASLKPDLEKVQQRYKQRSQKYTDNPEKLSEVQKDFKEQMMSLYQKNGGFNPLSGCLLSLLQFPVLIALYWSFSGSPFQPTSLFVNLQATTKVQTSKQKPSNSRVQNYVDSQGRVSQFKIETNAPKKVLINQPYEFEIKKIRGNANLPKNLEWEILGKDEDPRRIKKYLDKKALNQTDKSKQWYKDIVSLKISENRQRAKIKVLKETEKFSLAAFLPESKSGHQSFLFVKDLGEIGVFGKNQEIKWDLVVLILIMGVTFWLSTKITAKSSTQPPSLDPNQPDMQKQIQTIMPIAFLGMMFFIPIPAGVFLYFIVSNLLQVSQSLLIDYLPLNKTNSKK